MVLSSRKKQKFIVLIKETNDIDEINNFFMNNYWNKIENFVKLTRKVSMRWKNWSDLKAQHSIQFQGENRLKMKILFLNSVARYGNCKMKLIAWLIRCSLDWLLRCISGCQSLLDLLCAWEHWFDWFYLPLLTKYLQRQHHARGIRGSNLGTLLYGQGCTTRLSCEWLCVCNGFWPDLPMAPRIYCPKERRQIRVLTACTMCLCRRPRCCFIIFSRVDVCPGTSIPFHRLHCWPQLELS